MSSFPEFVQPAARGERWFASAWPGRWRHIDADWSRPDRPDEDRELRASIDAELLGVDLPEDVDRSLVAPLFVCDDCHALIIGVPSDARPRREWIGDWDATTWTWRPIPPRDPNEPWDPSAFALRLGGDHRHDDRSAPSDGRVRYYHQHALGPYKVETVGTLAEIVEGMPYFIWFGEPFPPLAVVNDALSTGWDNAGMSGGVEFPPSVMSDGEYERLKRSPRWDTIGYVDVDVPAGVHTREEMAAWWKSVLASFPSYAVGRFWEEFRSQLPYRESKSFTDDERRRRERRRVELSRHMVQEIERIVSDARLVIEVRVPMVLAGNRVTGGSSEPPDGEQGNTWRRVEGVLRSPLSTGVDGYAQMEWRDGELLGTLVFTGGAESADAIVSSVLRDLAAQPAPPLTITRDGGQIWPQGIEGP